MIPGALIAAAVLFAYVWSCGIHRCPDGNRYTSGQLQPTPFNRRFCSWPARLLMVTTWLSFVALSGLLGSWTSSLLFCTLPGVWFCAVHPTTVDAPAMLLAWLSSSLWSAGHTAAALSLSAASGLVHERGPAFAALYAWSPVPLVGLAVPLLLARVKGAAPPPRDSAELADRLVGHGTLGAISAHRAFVDLLSPSGLIWSLRALPVMAAHLGASPAGWASLAVAFASRLIGTDTARFLMWAGPPLCARLGDAPLWMVAVQVLSFRKAVQ